MNIKIKKMDSGRWAKVVRGTCLGALTLLMVVEALAQNAAGSSKAGNYLRNSGFSICATPGYPSYWGGHSPFSVPDWETGRYYGVDPETVSPVPGAKVLRTRWDGEVNRRIDSFWFVPTLPKGGTYTASVYLKAEGDLSVAIVINNGPQLEVKPGPEWKRFQFTFTANTNWTTYKPFMAFPIKGTGVLWIAAPQLEDGTVATPWQPSLFDVDKLAAKPLPQSLPAQFPCPVASTPPQIDGKLDDPCWSTAFKAKGFVDNNTGNPVEPRTEAFVTSDDSNLYVAFKCDEPLKGKPDWKACADSTDVFKSDAVEFFLAPSAFGEDYYHIALHPGGGVYTANDFTPGWRSGVKTAVIPSDKGWQAELALPLSSLNIKSGDIWRLNFCRTRVVDGKVIDSAWAGHNSFHAPNRFARMTGIKSSISQNRAWTFLSPRLRKEPDGTFTFSCRLDNRVNVGKKLAAELNAIPPLTNVLKCDFQMTRQRANLVIGGIPANLDPDAKLVLSLRDQVQKDILAEFTSQKVLYMLNPQADDSSPLSAFAEYSWYPSDVKEAKVRVEWRLDEPANVHLVLGNADQPAFAGNLQFAGPGKQTIRIPLDGITVGGNLPLNVTAEVEGTTLAATRDIIERRVSTPDSVGLNRFLRCFVVDGKPCFPIAFYPGNDLVKDWQFERLAAHGFNCLLPFTPPKIKENPVEAMRAMLDRCVKHGFKVIYWLQLSASQSASPKSVDQFCAVLADMVKTFRDHPAGLAWYIIDEPGPTVAYKESEFKRFYEATRAADPSRPIIVNYAFGNKIISGHGCILYGGNDSHDVSMCDRYPWFPDERFEPLVFYADTALNFNAALAPLGRVTPVWLQTFGGRDAFREPTPDEWQNNVYVSLIYGTRALGYWAGQPNSVPLWKRMGEVHAQIRELEPVLFNPDMETLNGIYENKVHYAIWSTSDAVHVMAANVAEYPAKLSLDLGELTGRKLGNGKALFEKETRRFKEGRILETLAPGQSKVYSFALKKS